MHILTEKALFDLGYQKLPDGRFAHPEAQLVIEPRGVWNIALIYQGIETFFLTEENMLDCLLNDMTDDQMLHRMCRYAKRWWKDFSGVV